MLVEVTTESKIRGWKVNANIGPMIPVLKIQLTSSSKAETATPSWRSFLYTIVYFPTDCVLPSFDSLKSIGLFP